MKKTIRYIFILLLCAIATTGAYAQTDTIRYVRTSGSYTNDGRSWETATNNLQAAINDLKDYLEQNHIPSGSVYVAEGTYLPTESTEPSGGSMLNTSFKIYEGIHVYGGFCEANPEARPGLRKMANDKTWDENWASRITIGAATDVQVSEHWNLKYKTILSGNHSAMPVTMTYDSIRGRYNTSFPANSYHVVWFGTNGRIPTSNDTLASHYLPLERKAWVDGCTIKNGNASQRATGSARNHGGYGGGAYLVANSELHNCIISHCAASMRGGGVYLDGGGRLEFCYIHTCQATGVGIEQGYGGGACIDYDGSVEHSYLTQNCARLGGGLAICHAPGEYPWRERIRARYGREPEEGDEISKYSPFSSATVVSNNTSNAEAGAVYMNEGGVLNHCSVLNNSCVGPDVMYFGRRHGRSGGVYIRNCGMLYNSVFWGNACPANNDIQFCSVRQRIEQDDQILVYHCGFMNHDVTDWTNVQKDMVFSLERENIPILGVEGNYPCFESPTAKAGVIYPEVYQAVRKWHPGIYTALAEKGVQVTDAIQDASQWIRHAHTTYGVVGNNFEPVSSIGALVRANEHVRHSMVVPQGLEYRNGETTPIPTIFVDPHRIGLFDKDSNYIVPTNTGQSWDYPLRSIGDAMMYLRNYLVEEPGNAIGERAHYHLPSAWDEDGHPTAYTDYDHVQVLVKEGEQSTAGRNNYLSNEMRTASIRMLSHMRLYGGYPKGLTGTETAGRDPMHLATKITANILGSSGEKAYKNNSAHVLTYVNAEYAIVDGFKLFNGNAHNLQYTASIMAGGGVIVNNETTPAEKRIDMVGNQLRNCRLANNSAPKGAAIYVNGEHKKRIGVVQQVCYAELTVVNCIIRNNTADYKSDAPHHIVENHGIITANGRAFIDMDHCDIVNNVGYPFKADNKTTQSNIEMPYHGFIRVDNSLIFCNGNERLDNRGDLGGVAKVTSVNPDGQDYVFGTYNLFDADLVLHEEDSSQPHGFFKEGFRKPNIAGVLPDGIPASDLIEGKHPLQLIMPDTQSEKQNQCIFTRTDRNDPNYPVFVNPARNVGHSYESDKPLFGGNISYMPLNTNPCVNAASHSRYGGNNIPRSDVEDYDLTDVNRRSYGGAPDIGAIENTNLPKDGMAVYVTPDGAGRRDGSSWANAIAGNTVYRLGTAAAAAGDSIDAANGARLIKKATGAPPVLTTDSRYMGGRYEDSNTLYPYGEKSNFSKTFWETTGNTPDNSIDNIIITNNREEDYVSGLQYAVEKASAYNTLAADAPERITGVDSIQVWVGNGTYTDFKGFVMRNKAKVFGGFPASTVPAPGMTERIALLSTEVPKPEQYNTKNIADYETILQISEVNPCGKVDVQEPAPFILTDSTIYRIKTKTGASSYKTGYYLYADNRIKHRDSTHVMVRAASTDTEDELWLKVSSTANDGSFVLYNIGTHTLVDWKTHKNGQYTYAAYLAPLDNYNTANCLFEYSSEFILRKGDNTKGFGTVNKNSGIWTDKTGNNRSKIEFESVRKISSAEENDIQPLFQPQMTQVDAMDYLAVYSGSGSTIVRKPVLAMPDETMPTWSPNDALPGASNDNVSNIHRYIRGKSGDKADPNYKQYANIAWDGFTIRNGYYNGYNANRDGGAGVRMFEGATVQNCVVLHNYNKGGKRMVGSSIRARGGGIYCDGDRSAVISCFVINNVTYCTNKNNEGRGGGMYMIVGTSYNSLFANNKADDGAGIYLQDAKFYNNTVVYNTANKTAGGMYQYHGSVPRNDLFVFNTIIYGNNKEAVLTKGKINSFKHCYVSTAKELDKKVTDSIPTTPEFGNQVIPVADFNNLAYNPFLLADTANKYNDYRLKSEMTGVFHGCVNAGLSEPNGVTLPDIDVAFSARVKDCQVDIGAYEYDGALFIRPDTTTHPGYAIFYVNYEGSGNASGDSKDNAACNMKLQQIIDAAGRYKHSLLTLPRYNKGNTSSFKSGEPNKHWTVQVRIAGDSIASRFSSSNPQTYTPSRSTKHSVPGYADNSLDYSFIIPHGVQVLGGYSPDYYHYEKDGAVVPAGTDGAAVVDERDVLTFRTILSGKTVSSTGAAGRAYHVVTFTNDLFDLNQKLYTKKEGDIDVQQTDQLAGIDSLKDAEVHRTVLDGLFIEDGFANSPDEPDRIGAAAVVPHYAHIRNCVVQNNEALNNGGGLYLQPRALVSGTIIRNNTASTGGGVYVEQPNRSTSSATYARIVSSTICHNHASTRAGGLWFDNNVRVNSSVLWRNTSNDFANVAGQFGSTTTAAEEADFAFAFTGVEVRKIEGYGNVELSPREEEGVRWDRKDPFNSIFYYPVEMSSTLARSGMTYGEWRRMSSQYPTLDSTDISGVSRLTWNEADVHRPYHWGDTLTIKSNDFIEMGARVVNRSYIIEPDTVRAMYRIYVVHTDLLNSEAARALQDNTRTDDVSLMYRQMGSSFLNPFHRLSDAFRYISTLRNQNPEKYRNRRFEVFLEKGDYMPYLNAHGEEDKVRTNTFCIPEGVSVIGGVNHKLEGHNYGQAGYFDKYHMDTPLNGTEDVNVITDEGVYTINNASTIQIRNDRETDDMNKNSVIEPWEFKSLTRLTGSTTSNDEAVHVYHVITCYADSVQLGRLPIKYRSYNEATHRFSDPINPLRKEDFKDECEQSQIARSIILDGLSIEGGYANMLDSADAANHPYQEKTYFRGGGIFVDGNWDKAFEADDNEIPNVTEPARHNIPLVIRCCNLYNNVAGNGGAIYSNGDLHIYMSHFSQNASEGPMTKRDQSLIPWSAGGCIATNAFCGVVNCLFDNNEARRGNYPITIDDESDEYIEDADVRQGFAGVISSAISSQVRALNCNFVRNKAVAYPAIFNFKSNSYYSTTDSMHFAFNCIFWGNEATGIDRTNAPADAKDIYHAKYAHHPNGIMHYDKDEYLRYNTLYSEYLSELEENYASEATKTKLNDLRAAGDKMEGVYFSAYEEGRGLGVAQPKQDYFVQHTGESVPEYRSLPVPTKPDGENVELDKLFTYLHGNHNILISSDNDDANGLNFIQPSLSAGTDGYIQTADWLMARMNSTTDQGWGALRQTVTRSIGWWENSKAIQDGIPIHFNDSATAADHFCKDCAEETKGIAFPVYDLDTATFDDTPSKAIYNFFAQKTYDQYSEWMTPVGKERYMYYTRQGDMAHNDMRRISAYPKKGEEEVYIDLGVYEYQYVQLHMPGSQVDTMWVTTTPKTDGKSDGLTWETATDRLQDAIEWVLCSNNNHDKYICLLGGTYVPQLGVHGQHSFLVTMPTDMMELYLPEDADCNTDFSVSSISFLGGWSTQSKEEGRNPEKYPTVFEMHPEATEGTGNQLVTIEEMTRRFMHRTFRADDFRQDTTVVPVAFDGITFVNPLSIQDDLSSNPFADNLKDNGGAAIYYRWQRQYKDDGGVHSPMMEKPLYPRKEVVDGSTKVTLPKLIISNCTFMDNGLRTENKLYRSSAVRIDQGGGDALIVNSLFHSNAGAPVFAPLAQNENDPSAAQVRAVPNRVRIINSTFALNGGHIDMRYAGSELHNSLVWKDDLNNDTLTQFAIGGTSYNKGGTAAATDSITRNAVFGMFGAESSSPYYNESLSSQNNDVFNGPSFVNPIEEATTEAERRARDFRLNPSVKTMNMADTALYKRKVFFLKYPDEEPGAPLWLRAIGLHHIAGKAADDRDMANTPRLHGAGMERGAYECRAVLRRVMYVQPNKPSDLSGDGSSWSNAYGQGHLQQAIDVAAIYTYLNREAPVETRRSYVYVKGSYDAAPEPVLTAQDGVHVYGSVPSNFIDTAWLDVDTYDNEECERFANRVRAAVPGVAAPSSRPTRIQGLIASGEAFKTGFLLDGFEITPIAEASPAVTAPVLLDNDSVALRNCIVSGFSTASGVPVADVKKGLVYNSLFYNNEASVHVKAGVHGLLLNNTIVSRAEDTPLDATDAPDGNVVNTIAAAGRDNGFAPYMTAQNPYSLPDYLTSHQPLAYQLHENSTWIDTGTDDDALSDAFAPFIRNRYIRFASDRDILGNPRKTGATVDEGAFETWRVAKKHSVLLTSLTNDVSYASESAEAKKGAFLTHYGGHYYPHPGSVVYLMDSSSMSMSGAGGEFATIIFRPGFMLLKPGASFYGNGHDVQMNYLAAEKRFIDQRYSMTAFPFDYNTADITTTSFVPATGENHSQLSTFNFSTSRYSGAARSEKDYVFHTDNSALWVPVETPERAATEGYLMDFGSVIEDTVLRFNSFAQPGQYVYTEDGQDKTVSLTQYDHRTASAEGGLDFTPQENMGWNMKGLPWLVSDYRTDTVVWADNYLRQMYIPHVLYLMDGSAAYPSIAGDQVYTSRSWDKGSTLSMGSAFLTQTATQGAEETVIFHQPSEGLNRPVPHPLLELSASPKVNRSPSGPLSVRQHPSSDFLAFIPDSSASKEVQYAYGRDGVKWTANDTLVQLYMLDSKRLSRISFLGAAPTDVDIPLGVNVPQNGPTANEFTFSLPEKEAFAGYRYLWLIDYEEQRYINLLEEAYQTEIAPGVNNGRFALRIGTFPKTDKKGNREYIVFARDGVLYVRGLIAGDRVTVYSAAGQLVTSAVATGSEVAIPLARQSGYLVRVNDHSAKVVN